MDEILYACAYFACDKTVSVVPKSKCILQGEFKEQEKVGVKWRVQGKQQVFIGTILHVSPKPEKHLLDKYAAHLHRFIRSAVSKGHEYTTRDLIAQWCKEKTRSDDGNVNESGSPPKKKRFLSKAKESMNDSLRRRNKDKTQQKKSIDASSMLAAQEIITVTQYNDVFPVISALQLEQQPHQQQVQQHRQQQLQQKRQQPQLQEQHPQFRQQRQQQPQLQQQRQQQPQLQRQQPQLQLQQHPQLQQQGQQQPQLQRQQPQLQQQRQQQPQLQRQQQPQLQQQQQQQQQLQQQQQQQMQQLHSQQKHTPEQHHRQRMPESLQRQQQKLPHEQNQQRRKQKQLLQLQPQQTYQQQPQQRHPEPQPSRTQERSVLQRHTPLEANNQLASLPPLTNLDQLIDEQQQRQQVYANSVSVVDLDETSDLGTTRSAFKSAMITLADYEEDFDGDPEDGPSLDDSGITEDITGIDEESENCEVDPRIELAALKKKIKQMEKENEELTVQLKTYQYAVPSNEVLGYFKRLVGLFEGEDIQALPEVAACCESFVIKANFNPSEGDVRLLKGYNVFVPGIKLRILVKEARVKGPLHLLQKLIPLVFSSEELAQSCGQGIGTSSTTKLQEAGDTKKPLDNAKVQVSNQSNCFVSDDLPEELKH